MSKKRHARNYYKKWTEMEEKYLVLQRRRGVQWNQIALALDRTTVACQSRLIVIEAREKEKRNAKVTRSIHE